MDDFAKLWIAIVFIVAVTILGLTGVATYRSLQDTAVLAEMVASGGDPIAARCAIENDRHNPACILVAATKNTSTNSSLPVSK